MGDRRVNLGVVIQSELHSGGGLQYELRTALELSKLSICKSVFFVFHDNTYRLLSEYGLDTILIRASFIDRFIRFLNRNIWFSNKLKIVSPFEKEIERYKIDIVYFLSPSGLALDLVRHSYIITVWDLCHREHPEFPEVSYYKEFERREYLYSNALKKAVAVITNSEQIRKKIVLWYGVNERRVHVVPFLPTLQSVSKANVDVKKKYRIEGEYIFYPAQFWPHKNHIYILDALKILKGMGEDLTVVFSGSDKGNLSYVMKYAEEIGVIDKVKYIGFVPPDEIYSLYRESLALVMPTYFGPTNLPPLEAFEVGTPVIYSGLEEFKEEVGDAALFVSLNEPVALAETLIKLRRNPDLRVDLVRRGKQKLKEMISKNNIGSVIEYVLNDYITKRKLWSSTS